jgi:hypothetical protein
MEGTLFSLEITDPGLGGGGPPAPVPSLGVLARLTLAMLLLGAGRRGARTLAASRGADRPHGGGP